MLDPRGTFVALITPFRGGEVDEEALRALVERLVEGGVEGLIPCGTTGESVSLDGAEHEAVVRAVVEQARGRLPVLAGAGTSSTRRTIELAANARRAGADGLMLVCPYYNKPTQDGLEAHFRAVAAEVPLPTILYNIPGRTACDLSVETLARLSDVPEIVGIKEATGTVHRAMQIASRCGDRFAVLAGDDAMTLPILSLGGTGVVSVSANAFPREVSEVPRLWFAGRVAEAQAAHLSMVALHEAMFVETNPGPIKAVLAEAGHIEPEIRLPLVWPSEASMATVRDVLRRVEATWDARRRAEVAA